ncbi:molybdopterin-dependent oxidoreductase [Chloroflexota bacterium]
MTAFLAACTRQLPHPPTTPVEFCDDAQATGSTDELGNTLTTCTDITNYNNFYEFSYGKEDIASLSRDFNTSPWIVTVGGLVNKPGTFSVDELIKEYQPEERIYRMRCVEGWSMVVPWIGFPLSRLLQDQFLAHPCRRCL